MVRELRDTTASIYSFPTCLHSISSRAACRDHGMPAISVCDTPFHGMDAVMKRVTDIVLAGCALLLLAPLLVLIALAVKLTSSGPVLFASAVRTERRRDLIYKFRS